MDKIFKPWTRLPPTPPKFWSCFLLPRVETGGQKKSNPPTWYVTHALFNIDIWGRRCHANHFLRVWIFCPSTVCILWLIHMKWYHVHILSILHNFVADLCRAVFMLQWFSCVGILGFMRFILCFPPSWAPHVWPHVAPSAPRYQHLPWASTPPSALNDDKIWLQTKRKNRKRQRKTEDQPRINKDQGARENMRRNDRKRIVQASQKNKRTSSVTRLILSRALSARVFPHRQELVWFGFRNRLHQS